MTTRLDVPLVSLDGERPSVKPSVVACRLAVALAVVTAAACALTFFLPDVLVGPDVMNGSARGTALVVLLATLPVLVAGLALTDRGSAFGVLLLSGAVAHLLYQSVLFLFATPFNDLFLLYVAMFGLALWVAIALAASLDAHAVRARIRPGIPVRPIAVFVWLVVGLNALAWLGAIVPLLREDGFPSYFIETQMTTNPLHVQDLAFWLPLMAVGAWWLWRDRDRGYVLVGAMLTMWLLESVTVAVDQWLGSGADPGSDVATIAGAWLFGAMAVVTVVPWVAFHRRVW
jgi:hypothetical protein